MKEIKAIIQPYMLDSVCSALEEIAGLPGLTVSKIQGFGKSRAAEPSDSHNERRWKFAQRRKVEIVVTDEMADVIKIRTGERGANVL
jgi:nitrogen regulatory protein P-II 1